LTSKAYKLAHVTC